MLGQGGCYRQCRRWRDIEFVENNPRLDVNALYRVGALSNGRISRWACRGLTVTIRAESKQIWIDDDQVIALERESFLNGRYKRTKFRCPACGRGCRVLHAKGRRFICLECAGFDYTSRHRFRWSAALGRAARLRKKLGADLRPGAPFSRPDGWNYKNYDRIAAAIIACEGELVESLHDMVADLSKRFGHE